MGEVERVIRIIPISLDSEIRGYFSQYSKNYQQQLERYWSEWCKFLSASFSGVGPLDATLSNALSYLSACLQLPGQTSRYNMNPAGRAIAPSTVRTRAWCLSSIYSHLMRLELVRRNPFDNADIPKRIRTAKNGTKRRTEALSLEDAHRVITAPPKTPEGQRDRCVFALALGGALRSSEIIGLNVGDVIREDKVMRVRLWDTKAGEAVQQLVASSVAGEVWRYCEIRRGEGASPNMPLIPRYIGHKATERRITRQMMGDLFERYRQALHLPVYFTPHSARKTAITVLIKAGVPLPEVAKIARHANVETTRIYYAEDDTTTIAALEKLKL